MTAPANRLWADIDTDRWRRNFQAIAASVTPLELLPVIKANGYGMGDRATARAFRSAGARAFAVSCVSEALRIHDLADWILILGASLPHEIPAIVAADLVPSVSDSNAVARFQREAEHQGRKLRVQVKVDSGMGRFGFSLKEAPDAVRHILTLPNLDLHGIFSHFAASGVHDDTTMGQLTGFRDLVTNLIDAGAKLPYRHIANSTAIAGLTAACQPPFNMVRSGIDLHGGHLSVTPRPYRTEPVLTLKARLLSVRRLNRGATVGYGRTYRVTATQGERIGVVSVGYADGYPRCLSNVGTMLVRGTRCPIRGIICMDYTMVSLRDVPDAEVGDEVVVIGRQGDGIISLAEVARAAETIPYELMCGLGSRVERHYLGETGQPA